MKVTMWANGYINKSKNELDVINSLNENVIKINQAFKSF